MSKYSDLPDKNCIEYIVNNIVDVKKKNNLQMKMRHID